MAAAWGYVCHFNRHYIYQLLRLAHISWILYKHLPNLISPFYHIYFPGNRNVYQCCFFVVTV